MALNTTAADKNSYPARDTVRQQLNNVIAILYYTTLCFLSGNALPAIAQGTTTTKVKTVNSVNYFVNGVPKTKAATDDLWTPAGANVATGLFQKYWLMLDAAGAASVQEGIPAATAAGVTFAALPPATKCIIAMIQVQNASAGAFIPGTTALNAAGITTTYTDGVDDSILAFMAQVTP